MTRGAKRRILVALLALGGAAALGAPLWAQCPDGAPPPCTATRRAATRVRPPAPAARGRTFLLLPFRNVTRAEPQEWLINGAPLMLADAFGQLRELTVVSDAQLTAARRRLNMTGDAAPDAAQLRRLAEETGGWTAVTGNVVATGGRLRLTAQAVDALDGRVVARADAEVTADVDVREAFDRLGAQLLAAAGLPPATTDLASMTTTSLDAYRAYVRGEALLKESAYRRARESYAEAVRLDSTFALAWARLALASGAWNIQAMFDPRSGAYTAAERAVALANRLPPQQAALLRAMHGWFRGRFSRSRATIDSLMAADPDDLTARELGAMFELMDPSMDTTGATPRLVSSMNRVVALAREVIERDPGRRYVYSVLGYIYGTAGGLWMGSFPGVRAELPSYAAIAFTPTEGFVPVLRDQFVTMPAAAFSALPEAERRRLRRRATDAGAIWIQRWLAAGPGDAEAHLWASRFAELQDSLPLALREANIADSLGVESGLETISGRRVMLAMRLGRFAEAGRIADSLGAAGALAARPFAPPFDNGRNFAIAALLATRRFSRASAVAVAGARLMRWQPACRALLEIPVWTTVALPPAVVAAIADTLALHAADVAADSILSMCVEPLQWLAQGPRRPAGGARLLTVAESLATAGRTDAAVRTARAAWNADSTLGSRLATLPWLAARHADIAPGRRLRPLNVIVDGDSVTFRYELTGTGPLRWDFPDLPLGFGFGVVITTGPAETDQAFFLDVNHAWQPRPSPAEGGVPEMLEATERNFSARHRTTAVEGMRGSRGATAGAMHLAIHGGVADEFRRLRPTTAQAWSSPCPPWEMAGNRCPLAPVPIEYR